MNFELEEIKRVTLDYFGINEYIFDKATKSKIAHFVRPRQIISYIASECGYRPTDIGKMLKVTYPTITYHKENVEVYMRVDKEYKKYVEDIMHRLMLSRVEYTLEGWLTRDKEEDGGFLYFTVGEKPKKDTDKEIWVINDGMMFDAPKEAFPQITWECEPWRCEMTLKAQAK